ncbi:hypothetical protein BHM03_00051005, partial [Ensete ventricosum]
FWRRRRTSRHTRLRWSRSETRDGRFPPNPITACIIPKIKYALKPRGPRRDAEPTNEVAPQGGSSLEAVAVGGSSRSQITPRRARRQEGKNLRNMGGGADGETPLARQGSIYSLTFDEFQSTLGGLGKDLGSMNMDELLKNIWNAEESYAMAATLGEGGGAGGAPGLQRQGSLTLPRTVSHKTVDEVWRGFVDASASASSSGQGPVVGGSSYVPRQPTLKEMTLEEFLVRAGVAREELTPSPIPPGPADTKINTPSVFFGTISSSTGLSLGFNRQNPSNGNVANAPIPHSSAANFGMTTTVARPYAAPMPSETGVDMGNPQGMRAGGLVSFGDAGMDNQLMKGMVALGTAGVVTAKGSPATHRSPDVLGKANGDLSSVSPAPYTVNSGMRGRKHSGAVEKVIERRQRRMIKNRESAARSRARKQVAFHYCSLAISFP